MKYLAIDFGIKRVGLAISSQDGIHAFPLCTYERTTRDALFEFILDTAKNENITAFVIGLPLSMNGEDTLTTSQARNFANSMKRRTELPIYLIDETLSSFEAEEYLSHVKQKNKKKILDQAAAMQILSSFLSYEYKENLIL